MTNQNFESVENRKESGVENLEQTPDLGAEQREALDYQGASLLEEPKNGSFVSSLQLFVDWVKSMVAKDE
jgi:hypothetical protein